MVTLTLSGFLRAKKPETARSLLQRIEKLTAIDLTTASLEQVRKGPDLFRFFVSVEIGSLSFRDAYFEIPARLAPISGRWSMTAPHPGAPTDRWDFEASTDRTSIAGVESLSFAVTSTRDAPEG
ncbi:MAG: hypothetical protein SangKO_079460 [Sandaracinaceae bacterium]